MQLYFFTSHIDPKLYKRAIECFLYDTLKTVDERWFNVLYDLSIAFYPSSVSHLDENFQGQNGIGGVTGINAIRLYVDDVKTSRNDIFHRAFRANMLAISHELCHHILIKMGFNNKVQLRNTDFGGHPAGTLLNFSTAEVHDRHIEKRFKTLTFWHWHKKIIPWKLSMQYLDITDLL